TQLESRVIKANSECSWLEVFAPIELSSTAAHHKDYSQAVAAAHQYMDEILPYETMHSLEKNADIVAQRVPEQLLHCGSGWGALEKCRRTLTAEREFPASMPFPAASMGDLQHPFNALLAGETPADDFITVPAWQCSEKWQPYFQNNSLFSLYQRGIYAYTNNDYKAAVDLATAALNSAKTREAKLFLRRFIARNLFLAGQYELAVTIFSELLTPQCDFQLYLDSVECFKSAGKLELFAEKLTAAEVPTEFQGRKQLMLLQSALSSNDLVTAEKIISHEFVVIDLLEGELALEELYLELQTKKLALSSMQNWDKSYHEAHKEQFAIPEYLDYRMIPEENK
ncbi:MAG: hypothetical protein RR060_06965, partial [Victivallaceae bacterium]